MKILIMPELAEHNKYNNDRGASGNIAALFSPVSHLSHAVVVLQVVSTYEAMQPFSTDTFRHTSRAYSFSSLLLGLFYFLLFAEAVFVAVLCLTAYITSGQLSTFLYACEGQMPLKHPIKVAN